MSEVEKKSEVEKITRLLVEGEKAKLSSDNWIVALLSSIASSTAVIADKLTESENKDRPTGEEVSE